VLDLEEHACATHICCFLKCSSIQLCFVPYWKVCLEEIGYDNDRDRNQIANFTYLDYATNIDISDAPPAEYVGRYRDKLGEEGYKLACAQNALPENFEQLSYPAFLSKRRLLMAQIVKKAFNELDK
jgi:hypothetical protein